MTNLGFLPMNLKQSANPCIGRAQLRQEPKSEYEQIKFQSNDDCFFYIPGIVYLQWVPEGETVNRHYYLHVLIKLRERIRKKRPELWKEKSYVLHQDNASAHSSLSVNRFLAKYSIPLLDHPPYSPDLASRDFYLFPMVKSALKGTKDCFEQWKNRKERFRDRVGVYIEGDNKLISIKSK